MANDLFPLGVADEERGLEVYIDDDGHAAWALMRSIGTTPKILAGVWLYNRPNGDDEPFQQNAKLGHLARNPREYIVDDPFEPISAADDLDIHFGGGPGLEAYAEINIRSNVHAYLEARAPLGWCVLATKSGPAAKAMVVTPCADGTSDVHLCDYKDE